MFVLHWNCGYLGYLAEINGYMIYIIRILSAHSVLVVFKVMQQLLKEDLLESAVFLAVVSVLAGFCKSSSSFSFVVLFSVINVLPWGFSSSFFLFPFAFLKKMTNIILPIRKTIFL